MPSEARSLPVTTIATPGRSRRRRADPDAAQVDAFLGEPLRQLRGNAKPVRPEDANAVQLLRDDDACVRRNRQL